jgi:hypothetical protein
VKLSPATRLSLSTAIGTAGIFLGVTSCLEPEKWHCPLSVVAVLVLVISWLSMPEDRELPWR